MKLSTKMLLGAAVLAVVPTLLTSFMVGGGAVQLSKEALTQSVQSQLTALREVRKQQVTDYFGSLVSSVQAFSGSTTVVDAYKGLRQAYSNTTELPKADERLTAVRLPIMLRIVLPALSNALISLFKDTSLASVIAVPELTYGANWIKTNTFRAVEVWMVVAPIYLVTGWIILAALRQLERTLLRGQRQ